MNVCAKMICSDSLSQIVMIHDRYWDLVRKIDKNCQILTCSVWVWMHKLMLGVDGVFAALSTSSLGDRNLTFVSDIRLSLH